MKRDLFPDPLLAKSFAALQAIIFCKDLGLKNIIVEGDAPQVVQGIQRTEEYGTCTRMADTREVLATFIQWSVKHIGRAKNTASHAHALGEKALDITNSLIELEEIFLCIHSLI